jgi:transketolase
MALAPLIYTPWNRVMQFDPQDPIWPNRDRFVLSNGHAPMLPWSHLSGTRAVNSEYERLGHPAVTLEDIRHFRQLDGRAPGHPENGWVSGVETTTGPLGQGVATSVGKAIAEKWLAHRYNRPGFEICVYNIYAVCEDGCLMERISLEAASLAAHLGLDNLCWIFDNNHITMEGNTDVTFTEDVAARFLAYGWNMLRVGDANDIDRIEHGIQIFRQTKDRLTFVVLDSHIGYGSPNKQGTAASHGEPLGENEVHLTKRYYGWPDDTHFLVPQGVYDHFASGVGARGAEARGVDGRPNTPSLPPRSTKLSGANSHPRGTAISPCFQPIRKVSRAARPREKCSTRLSRASHGPSAAWRIWGRRTRRSSPVRAISTPIAPAAGTSIWEFVNTRWRLS